MKDKKNIILIAVLVVAAAAIAAVVVFSVRMNKRDAGEDNTTEETTTAEPETTEPETPEETTAVPDDPEPYEPEGTPYVIDENNQVLYGWYPCTLMQNGIKGLEAAEYDDNNTAVIDGTRYMRVQNGDGYDYYRFEMIKWNVIAESGDAYTLLASSAVDCMPYNDAFAAASWEKSSLSAWLNGYFYDTAFSEEEKKESFRPNWALTGILFTITLPESISKPTYICFRRRICLILPAALTYTFRPTTPRGYAVRLLLRRQGACMCIRTATANGGRELTESRRATRYLSTATES